MALLSTETAKKALRLGPVGVASSLRNRNRARRMEYDGPPPEAADMNSPLEEWFWANDGPIVHKWLHYFSIYHRYFERFRGTPVRMLEIGVFDGGSLDMWRSYFGDDAVIFGIDIDRRCAEFDGKSAAVRIGSQDDPAFLAEVVEEMGGIDIVLDDGSHTSPHIRASLDALYPVLSEGGVYMIEDLHAAYWTEYGGGYDAPEGFMSDVKRMIDDIHHWHHSKGERIAATAGHLSGLHVYDSVVVLEKSATTMPRHCKRGGPTS